MKKLVIPIFILYILFLGIDLWFPAYRFLSPYLKFFSVALCFALVLVRGKTAVTHRDRLLVLSALAATLTADILLLFTALYAPGIFIFCGAHLFYIARYRKKLLGAAVALYVAALLFSVISRLLWPGLPQILIAGGCYAVLILTAFGSAFTAGLPQAQKRLAVIGMALFVLCDINVLFFNLFPHSGYHPAAGLLMWFFYLPSQLCIALSAGGDERKGPAAK